MRRQVGIPGGLSLRLVTSCLFVAAVASSWAQGSAIFAKYKNAIVKVETKDAVGTGFFVGDGSLVMTNFHVISGFEKATVNGYGSGWVILADPYADVAIIKVSKKSNVVVRFAATKPSPGEKIYAIGNPLGILDRSISEGIVSGFRSEDGGNVMQFTAAISEGSSGSPLFNSKGQVVGMAKSSVEEGQSLNFAVPGIYLSKFVGVAKEEIARGFHGTLASSVGGRPLSYHTGVITADVGGYKIPNGADKYRVKSLFGGTKVIYTWSSDPKWLIIINEDVTSTYVLANRVKPTESSFLALYYKRQKQNGKDEDIKPADGGESGEKLEIVPPITLTSSAQNTGRALLDQFSIDYENELLSLWLHGEKKGDDSDLGLMFLTYRDRESTFLTPQALTMYFDCLGRTGYRARVVLPEKQLTYIVKPREDKDPVFTNCIIIETSKSLDQLLDVREVNQGFQIEKVHLEEGEFYSSESRDEDEPSSALLPGDKIVAYAFGTAQQSYTPRDWTLACRASQVFLHQTVYLTIVREGKAYLVGIAPKTRRDLYAFSTLGSRQNVVFPLKQTVLDTLRSLATYDPNSLSVLLVDQPSSGSGLKEGDQIMAYRVGDVPWTAIYGSFDDALIEPKAQLIGTDALELQVRRGQLIYTYQYSESERPTFDRTLPKFEEYEVDAKETMSSAIQSSLALRTVRGTVYVVDSSLEDIDNGDVLEAMSTMDRAPTAISDDGQFYRMLEKSRAKAVVLHFTRDGRKFKIKISRS